ncbi:hypothetical protein [Sphingomonas montanisoli]|uniref:Uncharacterized protein n=1 Tax=Sphingomonas montanisoli TaxID=2606412 RepID=A0A5D9C479_9SPHN|nr:hypothetical protein [Sphingomonas montanisoli]TZG26489.1 hypothetical protein FYJ91_16330 [Sphingomonas montanisoli]
MAVKNSDAPRRARIEELRAQRWRSEAEQAELKRLMMVQHTFEWRRGERIRRLRLELAELEQQAAAAMSPTLRLVA